MLAVLSPASGSVTAKHAFSSPRMSGGSQRCFCSAVPNTTTGFNPKMFICTADAPEKPAPDSLMACIKQRCLGDAKTGAAELLWHGDAEPAGLRDGAVELLGEAAIAVALQPILRVEALAQSRDAVADRELLGGEREIHELAAPRRALSRSMAEGSGSRWTAVACESGRKQSHSPLR